MKKIANTLFLGICTLTTLGLPTVVFAQSDEAELKSVEVLAENTLQAPDEIDDGIYDNYRREDLPKTSKTFQDFVVGPGRFALEVGPGESVTVDLNISNRLGGRRLFQFSTEDMSADTEDNDATIRLLGDTVGPYTIKDYISVPYERFYIENNQRAIVPVTITIPPDAEPGGFYGSILTEVLPDEAPVKSSDVAPSAPLVSRIGTLFYVTTPGEIEHEGSLLDFVTMPEKSFYFEGPIDMGLVYENTGSVHITPHGEVSVTNILGENVGQVEITPWFVMPNSIRTKELSWDREFLFGRYTVTAIMNRGYGDEVDERSLVFWVFPWKPISMTFAGVFVFFLTIRFLLRNFEFKRK